MALSKKPYKGTRDLFPTDKRVMEYMFSKMHEVAQSFGYEPYDGPLLEEVELYKAKSGEELINDQIYSFNDRGDRNVAIRPEMTPTLARMVAQVHRELPKPIRWYSIPNLMRYERPQKGRLREHWQFNCDIFGAPEGHGEIEILGLIVALMESYGASAEHFEILLNDRRVVDAIFNNVLKVNEEQSYKLYKLIDRSKKIGPEKLQEEIDCFGFEDNAGNAFKKYLELNSVRELIAFLRENNQTDVADNFEVMANKINELGLSSFYRYDPTIVRGLDYYTGLVFEVFDKNPENRRAISGGGSYANLLGIFNEQPLPGIGFGLGDVTLKDFLAVHGLLPDFSTPSNDLCLGYLDDVGFTTTQKLAVDLRKTGLKVVTMLEKSKPKKIFTLATKQGAKFIGMIGQNECDSGTIEIKNSTKKESQTFSMSEPQSIAHFINEA